MFEVIGKQIIGSGGLLPLIFLLVLALFSSLVIKGTFRMAQVASKFTSDEIPGKILEINSKLENEEIDSAEAKNRITVVKRHDKFYTTILHISEYIKTTYYVLIVFLLFFLSILLHEIETVRTFYGKVAESSNVIMGVITFLLIAVVIMSSGIVYLLRSNFNKK